jgi:hypothetical protein
MQFNRRSSLIETLCLCMFLLCSGHNEKAKDSFEAAVTADESNASAHYNLAVVLTTKFNLHGVICRLLCFIAVFTCACSCSKSHQTRQADPPTRPHSSPGGAFTRQHITEYGPRRGCAEVLRASCGNGGWTAATRGCRVFVILILILILIVISFREPTE